MRAESGLPRIIPQLIAIAMLGWAIVPSNPYGYYMVLRWVCCAIFAFLAIRALDQKRTPWVCTMTVAAGVYNPIIRVHATREFWTVVNIVTIAILIASIFVLKRREPMQTPTTSPK